MRVMPTADASCQTEPELESKEVLNIIFDQVIRSNMRMQDLRNRSKDMQDDIKMIKRFLAMNDSKEGKRMSFAIDPTEGKPKDYQDKDDEIEKRTLQLGSPWTSNISNMTRKFGCFTDLEHKPDLWPKTPPEEKLEDTKGTKGMTSKGMTSKEGGKTTSKEGKTSCQSTPGQAASDPPSEIEEDNSDADSPKDKLHHTWIVFEGDLDPVRMDQLSTEQEFAMENGMPYRYVDIQDSRYMKEKIAQREKEEEEKKKMLENAQKEKKEISTTANPVEEKDESSDSEEEPPRQIKRLRVEGGQDTKVIKEKSKEEKKERKPPGNPFDDKGRLIRTLD